MSGTIPALAPGWVDQLWHDLKAQGRAKLERPEEDWQRPGVRRSMAPAHKQRMREGLRAYHERRRAAKAGK